MPPRPLVAALLLLALPTPDAAALGLEVAPLPPVPTDGTPFEVNVTFTDLPADPVEVKAWIGGEDWQASRTWNGSAWIRADRYALSTPGDRSTWQTWVRLQVNPEARRHPDLLVDGSALLGLRTRQGDAMTTWTQPVELVHEPFHRTVGLAPGQTVEAYGPAGTLVARTSNPGTEPAVVDLAVPDPGTTVCLDGRCQPQASLLLAGVGQEQVALTTAGDQPADLSGAVLAVGDDRCPLDGALEPHQTFVLSLGEPGSGARCPGPAGPEERVELLDLGTVTDRATVPTWGWLTRDRHPPHAWAPRPLPAGAWPRAPEPRHVEGWSHAFGTREDGLATVLATIEGAKHRLTVASYLLTHGAVAGALARAAERGVEVSLVLEPGPIGGLPDREEALVQQLQASGVDVRWSQGPWSPRGVQHAKVLVADGHVVVVLTENLTHSGLPDDGRGNLGLGLGIANRTLAREVEALFGTSGPSTPWHPAGWTPFSGQVSVITSPENAWSEAGVIGLVRQTTGPIRGLSLTASPVTGGTTNPMLDALIEASARAPVQILFNGVGHEDRVDDANRPALAYLVAHPDRGDLEARLSTPSQGRVHAKALIGPGWAMVGSSNWGSGGLVVNREVNLLVVDDRISDHLAGLFDQAWTTQATAPRSIAWPGLPLALAALALGAKRARNGEKRSGRSGQLQAEPVQRPGPVGQAGATGMRRIQREQDGQQHERHDRPSSKRCGSHGVSSGAPSSLSGRICTYRRGARPEQ